MGDGPIGAGEERIWLEEAVGQVLHRGQFAVQEITWLDAGAESCPTCLWQDTACACGGGLLLPGLGSDVKTRVLVCHAVTGEVFHYLSGHLPGPEAKMQALLDAARLHGGAARVYRPVVGFKERWAPVIAHPDRERKWGVTG